VIDARRGRARSPAKTSKHDSLAGHMHTSHDDPASMNVVWSRNIRDTPDPSDGPSLVGLATVLPPKGHADALSTTFLLTRPPFPPTGTINHCEATVTAIDTTGAVTWQTPPRVCVGQSSSYVVDARAQMVMQASRVGDSCVIVVVGPGTNSAYGNLGCVQGFSCNTGRLLFNRTDLANGYYEPPGAFDMATGIYYVYTQPVASVLYWPRFRVAFDVHANRAVWNVSVADEVGGGSGGTSSASQAVLGGRDVVAFVEINVLVLRSLRTGKLIANYSTPYMPSSGPSVGAFVCGGDTLVLTLGNRVMWRVDVYSSGDVLWKSEASEEPMRKYIFPHGRADASLFVVSRRDGHEAYPCRWPEPPTKADWPRPLWKTSLPNVTGDSFDFWNRPVVLTAPTVTGAAIPHKNGVVLTSMNSKRNMTALDLATGAVLFDFVGDISTLFSLAPRTTNHQVPLLAVEGLAVVFDAGTSGVSGGGMKAVRATAWDSSTGSIVGVGPALASTGYVSGGVWAAGVAGAAVYQNSGTVLLATLPVQQ
jgi:hypothetical protein